MKYADDTTLMAESKEERKSLLMKMKEESGKAGLELNIQKTTITASKREAVKDFLSFGSKITADSDCSHEIKRCLLLGRKGMTNLDRVLKSRCHFADKCSYSQSYGFSSSHILM